MSRNGIYNHSWQTQNSSPWQARMAAHDRWTAARADVLSTGSTGRTSSYTPARLAAWLARADAGSTGSTERQQYFQELRAQRREERYLARQQQAAAYSGDTSLDPTSLRSSYPSPSSWNSFASNNFADSSYRSGFNQFGADQFGLNTQSPLNPLQRWQLERAITIVSEHASGRAVNPTTLARAQGLIQEAAYAGDPTAMQVLQRLGGGQNQGGIGQALLQVLFQFLQSRGSSARNTGTQQQGTQQQGMPQPDAPTSAALNKLIKVYDSVYAQTQDALKAHTQAYNKLSASEKNLVTEFANQAQQAINAGAAIDQRTQKLVAIAEQIQAANSVASNGTGTTGDTDAA